MDIAKIDKNFAASGVTESDVEWFDPLCQPFKLHGVFFDGERFLRMPEAVASSVSSDVAWLNTCTAGGRVRFTTDSPYIAIKCVEPSGSFMPHMPFTGSHGFSVYADGIYEGCVYPPVTAVAEKEKQFSFSGVRYIRSCRHKSEPAAKQVSVHFPLYNGVYRVYIGIKKGSALTEPAPYEIKKPVVFYGSSITQGGCASHPGGDYVATVCRSLDLDFINLGFSGSARGEMAMANYIGGLKMSAFVMDYDHNARDPESLRQTHLPFYQAFRAMQPDVPVLFMTKPDFDYDPMAEQRRDVVFETYRYAKDRGENVYFLDGELFYGSENRSAYAVDTCHPTDLGFDRMAKAVRPILCEMLDLH